MKKLLAATAALAVGCLALWLQGNATLPGQPPGGGKTTQPAGDAKSGDEKALLDAVYSYQEAFNKNDAKAVAEFFAENAELVDHQGNAVQGRDAIRQAFAKFFEKSPGVQVAVAIDWGRWLGGDSIIQHGAVRVTPKDGEPTYSTYSAVYVKRDGQWRVAMVREIPVSPGGSAAHSNLEALDWLVGHWVDEDDNTRITVACAWDKNKVFLKRKINVYAKELKKQPFAPADTPFTLTAVLECHETIGWDAGRGILRSWVFDSQGGFAEGIWLHKGDRWFVKSHGMSADGKKSSATHIFTPAGPEQYRWRSVGRTLGGELQPDIDEVVVRRVSSTKSDNDEK
jgi:uncharacterized protein (TIGR02246 family)